MDLDIRSLAVPGVLLSLLTALLFLRVARALPSERRTWLRVWATGLAMQSGAWASLALGGMLPSLTLGLGALLMLGSYVELTRAIRGFRGLPERRGALWAVVAAAIIGCFVTDAWAAPVQRVIVNSTAGLVLLVAMAWSLLCRGPEAPGHAARAAAAFVFFGIVAIAWRAITHVVLPAPVVPGTSHALVFLFLVVGAMFLSMVFVLMHAERAYLDLQRMASMDALTGVMARGAMQSEGRHLLAAAHRHQRPLSALLLDLDQFKSVNDSLGHDAGDAILRHVASRAKRVLRGEDVLCRLGGDEFVALLPRTDALGARIVAERMREDLMETPLLFQGQELPISVSIGVAASTGNGEELEALLHRADEAMYVAKRAGGDRVAIAAPD